ncbi:aldo/keto reductase [Streptococcus fryi]
MQETIILNNGVEIPKLGFGTWKSTEGEEAYQAVLKALEVGYRHIDTARIYKNEESVGRAIKDSGIPREDIFVTTKLWNNAHSYEQAKEALDASLSRLGLDYVDLYLIHWPNPLMFRESWKEANAETWRALEEALAEGKVRAIGVSNFMEHHLDALLETAKVMPAVNQIRLSPGITQESIVSKCRDLGIVLEAYSPFGEGELFGLPVLEDMAEKYGVSVAKLVLAWSLQHDFIPLPKSVTPSRIESNFDAFGLVISEEDMAILDTLEVPSSAPNPDTVSF